MNLLYKIKSIISNICKYKKLIFCGFYNIFKFYYWFIIYTKIIYNSEYIFLYHYIKKHEKKPLSLLLDI